MAKVKMVSTTMTEEQWNTLMQQVNDVDSVKTQVSELQDAVVELADIVSGEELQNG